ncbi:MAG: polysaccharide export protein [Lachnospiraceae bacterium]
MMDVNSNIEQNEIEIDLLELLYVLRRRILIILLSTFLAAGIFGAYSAFLATPIYESTSRLYILTQSTSLTSLTDIQVGTSLTQDYKELITSRSILEQVSKNLGLNVTYEALLQRVTISNPANTRIIGISVQDVDPDRAKAIADELANVSRDNISSIMSTDAPSVYEYGYVTNRPVSPNILRNTVIGALLGAFLSIAFVSVLYIMDDTVKTSEDVEKYLSLNTMASIPLRDSADKQKGDKKKDE